jgi:transposase
MLQKLASSALAKASNYAPALWPRLSRFLQYPDLGLSNNLAENSMRSVALGRKKSIRNCSQQAGPKVAAILSILEICPPLQQSRALLLGCCPPGFANASIQCLDPLTPHRLGPQIAESLGRKCASICTSRRLMRERLNDHI